MSEQSYNSRCHGKWSKNTISPLTPSFLTRMHQNLASYAIGICLVLLHLADGFPIFRQQPARLRKSIEASSLTLFDIASLLAISWQVACLKQLTSYVQTSHTVLTITLTAYTSILIALGALHTSWAHMRRHRYRLIFLFISIALCMVVTVLAGIKSLRAGSRWKAAFHFSRLICRRRGGGL
jgi:hypothetical protein